MSRSSLEWAALIGAPVGFVGWYFFRAPGKWFTWEELEVTSTGLENTPDLANRIRLIIFTRSVLDPLREWVGPLTVTSAFRTAEVNQAVGGAGGHCSGGEGCSQHTVGYGADVTSSSFTNDELASYLYELWSSGNGLPLYQVITYEDTTHLHLGYNPAFDKATGAGSLGETSFLEHQANGDYTSWTP